VPGLQSLSPYFLASYVSTQRLLKPVAGGGSAAVVKTPDGWAIGVPSA
jgi:hypothetical protein